MQTLNVKTLNLNEVHQLLKLQEKFNNNTFTNFLSLEPLTEFEQQELVQICADFQKYLSNGKVSEGMVKALTIFPLMRLAGFYRPPIEFSLEENIADITLEDEDITLTGRLDILAVNKAKFTASEVFLWILVIETKNSQFAPRAGLPQLLTYASGSLKSQESVWGLATNGEFYQFVSLKQGNPPTYQLMPPLNLMESKSAMQLLQAFKAISQL